MRNLIGVFLLSICGQASADGFYMEGGLFYNPSAYGITSNAVAHAAIGYDQVLPDNFEVDISLKHESDPYNSGSEDLIAYESIGVVVRKRF
jgi:hypothetical protein